MQELLVNREFQSRDTPLQALLWAEIRPFSGTVGI